MEEPYTEVTMKKCVVVFLAVSIATASAALAGESDLQPGANKVKGSKSNTSERIEPVQVPNRPQDEGDAAKVKSSKSNSSERGTVKSGKSNSSD